jgi:hypothetical protein
MSTHENLLNFCWVGVRVPDSVKARLDAYLEEHGLLLQHWVRLAIEEKLDRDEKRKD